MIVSGPLHTVDKQTVDDTDKGRKSEDNAFHAGAFQRCSLKLMLNYGRIFVLCASLARIQKLQSTAAEYDPETDDKDISHLWRSLAATIMDQLACFIRERAYSCQLSWSPTYPALNIAFVSKSTHAPGKGIICEWVGFG